MRFFFKKYRWYVIIVLIMTTILVWHTILIEGEKVLEISFFDVGQGDAIFIKSPDGNQVLVDGGPPNGRVLRELGKAMPFYDRFIDVVIATHSDQDHLGGLIDVLERYKIGLVIDSGVYGEGASHTQEKLLLENKKIKTITGKRGTTLDLGDGVRLEILFPDRDVAGMESNSTSIITRLVYKNHEFLLTGDAPQNIENYIVSEGDIKSDVLKVGHHGSNTSTSPIFLGKVKPNFAIISAGKDNPYGHPHKEVVSLLENFGVTVFETSKMGTITFVSDGRDLKIK